MTDEQGPSGPADADAAQGQGPSVEAPQPDARVIINTHYIKDLSFENPNAPTVFAHREGHQIKISIEVRAVNLQQRHYEVTLGIKATGTVQEQTAFIVELDFAGLVTVGELVAETEIERLLSVEVARYLFPFARNVIADVSRDGGYPPLLINPIDFEHIYQQKAAKTAEPVAETA